MAQDAAQTMNTAGGVDPSSLGDLSSISGLGTDLQATLSGLDAGSGATTSSAGGGWWDTMVSDVKAGLTTTGAVGNSAATFLKNTAQAASNASQNAVHSLTNPISQAASAIWTQLSMLEWIVIVALVVLAVIAFRSPETLGNVSRLLAV